MAKSNFYVLLDSGHGRKLEQFGPYLLARPCSQAVWKPSLPEKTWNAADASFSREGENKWSKIRSLPELWHLHISNLVFKLSPTDFGHLGVFPEQRELWDWIQSVLTESSEFSFSSPPRVLNLFAYSGGSTLAAAKAGAAVCHLDSSKGMVSWARENAALNGLEDAPIRWIVDDVKKFLDRELRRGSRYEAVILDPPSFGRGAKGEVFKIEEDILPLLDICKALLSSKPLFVLFTCHTPGFSPMVMHHLMSQLMDDTPGHLEVGEMTLTGGPDVLPVPSGTFAKFQFK